MAKSTRRRSRRRRTHIVPVAILFGAVATGAVITPACDQTEGSLDMRVYPPDVSAHAFGMDLAHQGPDLGPDDGGSGD